MHTPGARIFLLLCLLLGSAVPAWSSPAEPEEISPGDPASEDRALTTADFPEKPYWRTNLFGRFFSDQKYLFTTWWPAEFQHARFTLPLLAGMSLAMYSARFDDGGADL